MSGFAGVVGPPGSSVEPAVAEALCAAIRYCGPDRHDEWREGPAALAHALLATTFEERLDRQPLSFDGQVRIVCDARIDARAELVRRLRAGGRDASLELPDSALILHAYHLWGEDCVAHLIGDFAFAIRDGRADTLFCARDQLGVVPLYYSEIGGALAFANTAEAILAHPHVDRTLNRTAVGDYLLFGYSLDPARGFHSRILRVPPAHCLSYSAGTVRVRRYWEPPEPTRQDAAADAREALEEFGRLTGEAVKDRLRFDRIATTLSGGMDSTLVTALAKRHGPAGMRLDAYSGGYDWLLPDDERYRAGLCAEHVGVAFHSVSSEQSIFDPPGGEHWRDTAEPKFILRTSASANIVGRIASDGARVLLMGMGGDTLVAGGPAHWRALARDRRYAGLSGHVWRYWRHFRRRPPLRAAFRRDGDVPPLLAPLDPDFAAEQKLAERWRDHWRGQLSTDPRKGMANHPFWSELFTAFDPESHRLPIKTRQPLFDLRLIEAAMRMPVTPWQFGKEALRRIGGDLLPASILERPKTGFGRDLEWELARRGYSPWLHRLDEAPELAGYVDRRRLREYLKETAAIPQNRFSQAVMLPASLAYWLGWRAETSVAARR